MVKETGRVWKFLGRVSGLFGSKDPGHRDPALEGAMETAQRAVELARTLRAQAGIRTRQPLARLWIALPGGERPELDALLDLVADEVNVHEVVRIGDESTLVERRVKPLLPKIGKKLKGGDTFTIAGRRAARERVGEQLLAAAPEPDLAARSDGEDREQGHRGDGDVRAVGQERVDRLGAFAALGLDRVVAFPSRWDISVDGLASFAEASAPKGFGVRDSGW